MSVGSAAASKGFSAHLRATFVLGLPLVGAQLTQMLVGVTDTVMLGWLGTTELAAGTLAFQVFFIFLIFGLGFGAAMMPLIANALGRDDPRSVRRAARMGLWALFALAVLFMVPLWFTSEILVALKQRENLAQLAENYMQIAQWSMIPAFILIGLRSFLTSLEKANAVLMITLAMAILNGLLNYALIFGNWGAPRLEMEGAGIATVIANSIGALFAVAYVAQSRSARPYEIFTRLWRPDWPALRTIASLGFPISLAIFAEAGMFAAASLMIGWLGEIPLAAHGIALQWASLAFMVPLGLAQASSVRVGNAAGRGDKAAIGLAANASVAMGLMFGVVAALIFLLIPEQLIALFLADSNPDKPAVLLYAVSLLYMAAAFQLFDALQVASSANLRGLQDTKVPMVIAAVSYWAFGMSAAYIFGFVFGWSGAGIWGGLVFGLAIASLAMTLRFNARERLGLV